MWKSMLQKPVAAGLILLLAAMPAMPITGAGAKDVRVPDRAMIELAADYNRQTGGETMLVLHRGETVFEEYPNGWSAGEPHLLASGSKSFVGLAAIAAAEDGYIRLDDPASTSLTEWKDDPEKSAITYRQLLTFTSGMTASEPGTAIKGETPAWAEIIDKPMKHKPGETFEYGAYHLYAFGEALQRILQKKTGETFESYLKRRILEPIGIKVEWRMRCKDGNPQLGGGAYMTAKDWAAVGEFVRNKGEANGKSVIGAALIDELFVGTKANPAYGLTWWLKRPIPEELDVETGHGGSLANSTWAPDDLVMAAGLGEQRLYVIPSLQLVVVRNGPVSKARTYRDVAFLSRLLRGIPDESENGDPNPDQGNAKPPLDLPAAPAAVLLETGNPYIVAGGERNALDLSLKTKPFHAQGTPMVPIRAVSELFGARVEWNGTDSAVVITDGRTSASIQPGSPTITVNGNSVRISPPATVVNGTTYAPLAVLAENILGKHAAVQEDYMLISEAPLKRIPNAWIEILKQDMARNG